VDLLQILRLVRRDILTLVELRREAITLLSRHKAVRNSLIADEVLRLQFVRAHLNLDFIIAYVREHLSFRNLVGIALCESRRLNRMIDRPVHLALCMWRYIIHSLELLCTRLPRFLFCTGYDRLVLCIAHKWNTIPCVGVVN